MAMMNCKECKKPVSTMAKNCPNCGVEVKTFEKSTVGFISGLFRIIGGLIGLFVGLYLVNEFMGGF